MATSFVLCDEELNEHGNTILETRVEQLSVGFVGQPYQDWIIDELEEPKEEKEVIPGIYVCAKCSNELFSSLAKLSSSAESSLPNFSKAIRNGALSRIPEKDSINSFQVACSKCLNHIGREEILNTFHDRQPTSHFTIIDKNVLRLVRSDINEGKKRKKKS